MSYDKIKQKLMDIGVIIDVNKGAFPILYDVQDNPIMVYRVTPELPVASSKVIMQLIGDTRVFFSWRRL